MDKFNPEEQFNELMQIAKQRAGLLGLLTAILDDQRELTSEQIKGAILRCMCNLIDTDGMVYDWMDKRFVEAAKACCEQNVFLDEVKDLLKG